VEYRKAVELEPRFARCFYVLGRALQDKRDPAAALQDLQKASALDPGNSTYRKAVEDLQRQLRH